MQNCRIKAFFDETTFTVSYIVWHLQSGECAIIDSVLDYDPKSATTSQDSADKLVIFIQRNNLKLRWILETHVHADHLSAACWLKEKLGGKIVIGAQVKTIQKIFSGLFNLGDDFPCDGRQFDLLVKDQQKLPLGDSALTVWSVPGHTPACVAYLIEDAVFVGDTMFMPDVGSARCDFPGGDARILYKSVKRILALPPETILYMCHDYAPDGRAYRWQTSVADQRRNNPHIGDAVDEEGFVALREARDKELAVPVLLFPAVQVNMRAGHFPEPESNGASYLKIPVNLM